MPGQPANAGYLKAITVLFTAMLAGQLIFAALAFYLTASGSVQNSMPELENIFFILAPALIISGRLSGTILYKKKLQQALTTTTISEKLSLYRSVFITRCALLEGPVLFAIITYLLTSQIVLLAFAGGGIVLFRMLKPTKEKIAAALQISPDNIS